MIPTIHDPQPGPSGNAHKHGLAATDPIFISRLHPEDRALLERLRNQLFAEHDPQTSVEEMIIDKIAIHLFRQYRFYRLEYHSVNAGMNYDPTGQTTLPHLDRLSRYDSRIAQHLATLQKALVAAQRSRQPMNPDSQEKN